VSKAHKVGFLGDSEKKSKENNERGCAEQRKKIAVIVIL
jgi:hypothetical protein